MSISPNTHLNTHLLRKASRHWGIQPSYINNQGQPVWAQQHSLLKILSNLAESEIKSDSDLTNIISQRKNAIYDRGVEPTHIMWQNERSFLDLYFHTDELSHKAQITIQLEDKFETQRFELTASLIHQRWLLPDALPLGYHSLNIEIKNRRSHCLLVMAPHKLFANPELQNSWGPFVPLYAARSQSDWGIGSLTELEKIMKFTQSYGAQWAGTLPLLAGNFDHPDCDPSPYSALTRLFWNEIYLDVEKLARERNSQTALSAIQNSDFKNTLAQLHKTEYVDYYGVYQAKKKILLTLSQEFFSSQETSSAHYKNFLSQNSDLNDYALFRTQDKSNLIEQNFHKYVQYETSRSMEQLKNNHHNLYLDFPVGVNESGFDFFKYKNNFFSAVSVGAPPEPVFQLGQDWGFPAFHPIRIRENGYDYLRKSLQNHLRYSKILRLDHVMGLHRVFCVPKGLKGDEGVYLRFKPEEMFAIVCLESHRAKVDFVGENLGTVPDAVDKTINKRECNGMWVYQMQTHMAPENKKNLIPKNVMSSFNTHDMPMFQNFVNTEDLDQLADLKILSESYRKPFRLARIKEIATWSDHFKVEGQNKNNQLFLKLLDWITQSPARFFVLNIEDAWQETRSQNIPGTYKEVPNWRRKFQFLVENWPQNALLMSTLNVLKTNRGLNDKK